MAEGRKHGQGHVIDAAKAKAAFRAAPPLPPSDAITIAPDTGSNQSKAASRKPDKQSHLEQLLAIAEESHFFHTPDKKAFADIHVAGHRETLRVVRAEYGVYLRKRFYDIHKGATSAETLKSALETLEARALFDGPELSVGLRTGAFEGRIYIDLCNGEWTAVEVSATGWEIVAEPPLRFRRTNGMLPLPQPSRPGSLDALRQILNLKSDDDFILAIAWILAALRSIGPYPPLIISGEQGSAKSTFSRDVRNLVDPNSVPLRSPPKDERDLHISAANAHVQAFDNISGLTSDESDNFCRLSTGGGFSTRELYSDAGETLFSAMRPIIANGIGDFVYRPDLAERSIFLNRLPISEADRKTEETLLAESKAAAPVIFGGLLDAMVHGLAMFPSTQTKNLPRMADFAKWAISCGDGLLWPHGAFLAAFQRNRARAIESILADDSVSAGVQALIARQPDGRWQGTAAQLLIALRAQAGPSGYGGDMPTCPRVLSTRLRRAETFLRQAGIIITKRNTRDARIIMIQASV
jgi:hypothetical protein